MTPDADKLTGVQRAAVFLMSLGENDAAEILKHMDAREVQKLGMAMATVNKVSRMQVESVVDDFVGALESQTALGIGTDQYIRNVMVQALGHEKAGSLVDRILNGRNTKGLEALKWMEPRAVADLIRHEHPQIMAIVLAHLESDQAAEVLGMLPEAARPDVLLRIATLDDVPPNALLELNQIMERQFAGGQSMKVPSIGGEKVVAGILNHLDSTIEQAVLGAIRSVDEPLGARLQDLMFVFDNLTNLDDRAIQTVLRDVPGDQLALALRGADPAVRDKITRNMSQRAAQILIEDMESRGPVRLSDVETAQKEILAIVRRLADEGTIAIGGGGEDFV